MKQQLSHRLVPAVAGMMALAFTYSLQAQSQPGKAEVRAVRGSATYMVSGGPAQPLKAKTILPTGTTVKTGPASVVELALGPAGIVRVTENTTLTIDRLNVTDTGAETVSETQLNLPEGTIYFNVHKLSAASKYEIKFPNGMAGIRGSRGRVSSTGYAVLLDGTMVIVYVPPGQQPTPYTLVAPPPVYFSPLEGVKPAPEDLIREVSSQGGGTITAGTTSDPVITQPPYKDPFISPATGGPQP
jgi:hypothetical protein